ITSDNGAIHHSLDLEVKEMEIKMDEIRICLLDLKKKALSDDRLDINEKQYLLSHFSNILKATTVYFHKRNMLNWTWINNHLDYMHQYLLPAANYSIFFINLIQHTIGEELTPVRKNLQVKKQNIERWANVSLKKLDTITDQFISKDFLLEFKNMMMKFSKEARSLDISSNKMWFSGRAFLLLLPSLHGLTVLFIIVVATTLGIHEIRRLNVNNETTLQYRVCYGAKVLQTGVLIGLAFLWLHLILAGVMYITSVMMTMLCLPVMDLTIFTRYTDDIKVWGNKTWIDSVMEQFASDYTEKIKFLQLLNKCKDNQTLYTALNMEKYWDIKHYMNLDNLKLEETEVIQAVDTAIQKNTTTRYSYHQ
ncbi:hypothetical protein L9F63_025241, partial [Diploptera punctata]